MQAKPNILISAVILSITIALSLVAGEIIVRVKNSSMNNYDIEMWKYARELKVKSPDPALDFDHVHSRSATLEKVEIRLNEWGLRGGPVEPLPSGGRRILFLGGSITLGWAVAEDDTVENRVQASLRDSGEQVQVLNGGVANYNSERYVSRFFDDLTGLQPTDIVVHYFLRDAEDLPPSSGNVLLRNSQLAVTLWIAYNRFFEASSESSLIDHYKNVYRPDAPGFRVMNEQMEKLAKYAKDHNIRVYLAMMPDVHNLTDYKFGFVHDLMHGIADKNGFAYIDLLPAFAGHSPQELWAMPGDPHPNAQGHRLMADVIAPAIALPGNANASGH